MDAALPASETTNHTLRGVIAMVGAVCVFAVMDAVMKRVSGNYGPFQIASLRCFSSLIILLVPLTWNRSWAQLRSTRMPLHVLRGALGVAMLALFVYAVRHLSLAETYSLFLCAPLMITALSGPLLGDRIPLVRWVAVAIGLGGVLYILRPGAGGIASLGGVAAAAAALVYALSAITVRTLGRTDPALSMVFWFLLLAGIGAALLGLGDWRPIASGDWLWFALIGVSGFLGQYGITVAFKYAAPSVVAPIEYTAILWAIGIDWLFWAVMPSRNMIVGASIIIASGLYVIWNERRSSREAVEPACPPP
jgi:drug/metabolite transporter (DMT)-like permease